MTDELDELRLTSSSSPSSAGELALGVGAEDETGEGRGTGKGAPACFSALAALAAFSRAIMESFVATGVMVACATTGAAEGAGGAEYAEAAWVAGPGA